MKTSKGLKQAYELQDFTFEAAMSLKDTLPREDGKLKIAREDAQAIAALVKSWESCQQRIQVHRRVPNPGSLKHDPKKPKARRARYWPLEITPTAPPTE
jgi:hypothetical protein